MNQKEVFLPSDLFPVFPVNLLPAVHSGWSGPSTWHTETRSYMLKTTKPLIVLLFSVLIFVHVEKTVNRVQLNVNNLFVQIPFWAHSEWFLFLLFSLAVKTDEEHKDSNKSSNNENSDQNEKPPWVICFYWFSIYI